MLAFKIAIMVLATFLTVTFIAVGFDGPRRTREVDSTGAWVKGDDVLHTSIIACSNGMKAGEVWLHSDDVTWEASVTGYRGQQFVSEQSAKKQVERLIVVLKICNDN